MMRTDDGQTRMAYREHLGGSLDDSRGGTEQERGPSPLCRPVEQERSEEVAVQIGRKGTTQQASAQQHSLAVVQHQVGRLKYLEMALVLHREVDRVRVLYRDPSRVVPIEQILCLVDGGRRRETGERDAQQIDRLDAVTWLHRGGSMPSYPVTPAPRPATRANGDRDDGPVSTTTHDSTPRAGALPRSWKQPLGAFTERWGTALAVALLIVGIVAWALGSGFLAFWAFVWAAVAFALVLPLPYALVSPLFMGVVGWLVNMLPLLILVGWGAVVARWALGLLSERRLPRGGRWIWVPIGLTAWTALGLLV